MPKDFSQLRNQISLAKLESYGDNALGLIVVAVTGDDAICGVIYNVFKEKRRIWLCQAYDYTTEQSFGTFVTLLYDDIEILSAVKFDKEVREVLMKKRVAEYKKSKMLIGRRWVAPDDAEDQDEEEFDEAKCFENLPKPYGACTRPELVVTLTSVDDTFQQAIADINKEEMICISAHGNLLGRNGILGWLSIATSTVVYNFDVMQIGIDNLISKGSDVTTILTNKYKVKVFCDCRFFQDYLLHKHSIRLNNVFDIRFTDWFLNKVNKDNINIFNNLSDFLTQYYQLPENHPLRHVIEMPNNSAWLERPLDPKLELCSIASVKFLRELRQAMVDTLLAGLQFDTNDFLEHLASMDTHTASIAQTDLVPAKFIQNWH